MSEITKKNIEFLSNLELTSLGISEKDKNSASSVLRDLSLPTTRVEEWKYTRVAKIANLDFSNSEASIQDIVPFIIDNEAYNLVFINGHFVEALSDESLPSGVQFKILSKHKNTVLKNTALTLSNEIFNSINTLYLNDGVRIDIDEKSIIEKPIQILHILDGNYSISNFRTIINAGKSSESNIIQGFFTASGENNFCNNISEINLEANAKLCLNKIQYESEKGYHISTEQVNQEKDSTFTINTITLNGGLVRNNLNIDVNGQNCMTHLNGAYLLKNKQHVDNHTIVDHKISHCESHELYKGVIDDDATGVFNGKVFVRKDAQKINAFQSNGNVLLTDNATINSKPELEIYADDVKCSHGSTTGQLDEEAVFYLRSRGISEKSARQLLISAFIGDVLEKIENDNVRSFINKIMQDRFNWAS